MVSLQPLRRSLADEIRQALLAAGMEMRRVKEGKFDAFFKKDEICLALKPALAIRHGNIHLECSIAAIDCEFERSVGCEPFGLCSFQTFAAYYANFDELYRDSWINPDRASDDLRAALTPYLDLTARYPNSRIVMSAELRSGFFGGLPIRHFVWSPAKADAFRDWLGLSDLRPSLEQ